MSRVFVVPLLLALSAAAQTLVLQDVNLIDGTGAPARAHMRVVVNGGRIQSIGEASGATPPAAVVWNLHGMTVIPGLIDAHVHLSGADAPETEKLLRFALMGGVTSVRDMGGDDIVLGEMARRFASPSEAGPRIYYSMIAAGPQWFADPRAKASAHGGVPGQIAWLRAITPETDLPAAIAAGKAAGATGLKIYADLPTDLVARVTAETHRQGLRVWAHSAIFPAKPSDGVKAGIDVVSHTVYLGAEGMDPPPGSYEEARRGLGIDYAKTSVDGEAMTNLLHLMKDKRTILDETLFVTNLTKRSEEDPIWLWTIAATRRAHDAGVPLAAGTDSFGDPEHAAVPNLHREMELLVVKCGLTPLEALHAATAVAARAIESTRITAR